MESTTRISFDLSTFSRQIPTYLKKNFEKKFNLWLNQVESAGWVNVLDRLDIESGSVEHQSAFLKELPEFIRVGAIKPIKSAGYSIANYFDGHDFPALITFRNKSGILNFSAHAKGRMSQLMQGYLIQFFHRMDPALVKCTVIDQRNFGSAYSLLPFSGNYYRSKRG